MKLLRLVAWVAVVFLVCVAPVGAQQPGTSVFSGVGVGATLGMALSIIGAGYGLGRIGSAAVESIARQPEVAARVQTAMIIVAAMLEGATLASVLLCYLLGGKATF